MNLLSCSSFLIPFGNLTAEWLHLVLYFSTEYHNSRQNIMILFWKYLVDIRSEAWLNLFCELINGKLFAVHTGQYISWYIYVILIYSRVFIFTMASAERGSPPSCGFYSCQYPKTIIDDMRLEEWYCPCYCTTPLKVPKCENFGLLFIR